MSNEKLNISLLCAEEAMKWVDIQINSQYWCNENLLKRYEFVDLYKTVIHS